MSKPKDFQKKSADRIVDLFLSGQRRVLLADEVGLGKTIVARAVVEKMRKQAISRGESFKVIYVCSNQSIIRQNANNLGIESDRVVSLEDSRLSMQHHVLFNELDNDYLIPITPSTSLAQTWGYGNAKERALIYSLIKSEFKSEELEALKTYLDAYACDNTGAINHTYYFQEDRIKDYSKEEPDYYSYIKQVLAQRKEYDDIIRGLKTEIKHPKPNRKHINELRTLFSEISMDMLQPNLVIMDEFQRYRDLMKDSEKTEENRLAQKLFNAENHPYILLVSATPYKPMATMEEIAQTGKNDHFEDFKLLIKFLMDDAYDCFEKKWDAYSRTLATLTNETFDKLLQQKSKVEQALRNIVVRTERYIPNLATYHAKIVQPSVHEVNEYKLLRKLIESASVELQTNKKLSLNIDYVKSCPHLLSFMQDYVEKSYIESAFKGKPGPKTKLFDGLLIKESVLTNRKKRFELHNARLQALTEILFQKGKESSNLLWVPASMPYYNSNSIFEKCGEFSKILVFSRWGFVPRMIATVVSHMATRQFVGSSKNSGGYNALERYKEILLNPFPDIYRPLIKDKTRSVDEVRKYIKESLCSKDFTGLLENKSKDFVADLLIASPGVTMYRCFGEDYLKSYEAKEEGGLYQVANDFINMLGNEESQAIIRRNTKKNTKKKSTVLERTIEYCVKGNLQAVIDEYAFVLGYNKDMAEKDKKELCSAMSSAIINRSPLDIDTDVSFCMAKAKKTPIQRWFACDYAKITADEKQEKRKMSIQKAFNSPFRPFVLASTSVGQEGLDFHLYCRKIIHWNLPSNPINLEQRSGRINRFEGLAIRRTLVHLFGEKYDWASLFSHANNVWHNQYRQYNEMVPYWCVPKEIFDLKGGIERIENIFLLYPLSVDTEAYHKLMKQLALYRLTMGQPDQEFIIDILDKFKLSPEKQNELMFDLSPSSNRNK